MGVSEFAYCIPSISFFPPDAESPVEGSNTPIFIVSPDAAAPDACPASPPAGADPQAARPIVITPVIINAKIFFISILLKISTKRL